MSRLLVFQGDTRVQRGAAAASRADRDAQTDMGHVRADMHGGAETRLLPEPAAAPKLRAVAGGTSVRTIIPVAAADSHIGAIERALQFGPAMRIQRLAEAGFLLAAIFTQDVRFAYVTFCFTALQTLSPRWAPVGQVVARFAGPPAEHRVGDLYFDLGGIRGASAVSLLVQASGIGLVWAGYATAGLLVLTLPTASFLMAPTLGFCCGCWFYVLGRDWLARHGWLKRGFDDNRDIAITRHDGPDQPELPA
jgi:hypothetical protein